MLQNHHSTRLTTPERVKRLYLANPTASVSDVARLLDMSASTAHNWLVMTDTPIRSWPELCRNRRNKHKDYVLCRHQSASPEVIAEETGISIKKVISILQDNEVRRSRSQARQLYFEKRYASKREMVVNMLKTGVSGMEVARRLRLHYNTVYRWQKKYT